MKLQTRKLTLNKGSALIERFAFNANGVDLSGFKVAGYVKSKLSDRSALTTIEGKIDGGFLEVSIPSVKTRNLPVGQFIYSLEISKGPYQFTFTGYIDILP